MDGVEREEDVTLEGVRDGEGEGGADLEGAADGVDNLGRAERLDEVTLEGGVVVAEGEEEVELLFRFVCVCDLPAPEDALALPDCESEEGPVNTGLAVIASTFFNTRTRKFVYTPLL